MSLILFLLGLLALVLGAELLVRGASRIAGRFGIPPLIVGLTIVAFGTSAPELAVTLESAYSGKVDIALGNVIGSNIFNVLFVLGLTALIVPLVVQQKLIREEVPMILGISLLLWALAADGIVSRGEGLFLFSILVVYILMLVVRSRQETKAIEMQYSNAIEVSDSWDRHLFIQIVMLFGGLLLLVVGARWLVNAASSFASYLGVSEAVVGLTIVAAGTSFPELATSVMAAIRGHRDIAVGNVVGSNIFNILGVLGISAAAAPNGLPVSTQILETDLPIMVAVSLACLPIFFTGRQIARWEGLLFLIIYAAYMTYLILWAVEHELAGTFRVGMLFGLLPVALVLLLFDVWRLNEKRFRK